MIEREKEKGKRVRWEKVARDAKTERQVWEVIERKKERKRG